MTALWIRIQTSLKNTKWAKEWPTPCTVYYYKNKRKYKRVDTKMIMSKIPKHGKP
jgi:hypothetical protein